MPRTTIEARARRARTALAVATALVVGPLAGTGAHATTTRTVTVSGTVVQVEVDPRTSEPLGTETNPWLVDTGGPLLTIPTGLEAGLVRGQAVDVTITAATGLDDAAAVRAAGLGDPSGVVRGVTPTGPAPVHEGPPDPDGAHTLTVVPVRWAGHPATVPPGDALTLAQEAATQWAAMSGGRMTVTPAVAGTVTLAGSPTCDVAVVHNQVLEARAGDLRTGPRDHVVLASPWDDRCSWRTQATVGGGLSWVGDLWLRHQIAHTFGHNLGLGNSGVLGDIMNGHPIGSSVGRLDGAMSWLLGWSVAVDAPATPSADRELWPTEVRAPGEVVRFPVGDGVVVAPGRTWPTPGGPLTVQVLAVTMSAGVPRVRLLAQLLPGQTHRIAGTDRVLSSTGAATDQSAAVRLVQDGLDTTPPSAAVLTWPTSLDPVYYQDAVVRWEPASDTGTGVVGYTVEVDGEVVAHAGARDTQAVVPYATVGTHAWTVTATDAAGNTSTSAPVTVTAGGEELYLRIDGPGFDVPTAGPVVSLAWTTGPLLPPVGRFRITVDDVVVRHVAADVRALPLLLRPGRQRVGVDAVAADGSVAWSVVTLVQVTGETEAPFSDVAPSAPFYAETFWAAQRGITTGYPDGTFRPAAPITRDAMAAFLFRHSGGELSGFRAPDTSPFPDVPVTHPFYREIAWLRAEEITLGYPDGTFGGGRPVSRQAMAAFLHRLADAPADVDPRDGSFVDVPPGHPFGTAIRWLRLRGVSQGYADGTFRPDAPVTRQAMAAYLHRLEQPA